jgi:dihydrofolate synthase/folylpolyglutamate synthase
MMQSRRFDSLGEWLGWLATLHPKQIDMSLGRVRGVLEALGIAEPPYRVITVAGTNGKGSCVALLESVYRAAGFSVGAFTSPHLVRFNERIRFDGQDLDDETLVELFALIDAARGELTLSYFEASAVAAMLHFARADADVGVLEVGMGGRLDAVNAVDADAALIVSIALDHMEWLGPDRDAIAPGSAGRRRRLRSACRPHRGNPGAWRQGVAARA